MTESPPLKPPGGEEPRASGVLPEVPESVPASQRSLFWQLQAYGRQLIYQTVLRAGGEPSGAPFEPHVASLTERIVKQLKQRSFFAFESLERLRPRRERNRFTRHGAAPFRGPYMPPSPPPQAAPTALGQMLRWLRRTGKPRPPRT